MMKKLFIAVLFAVCVVSFALAQSNQTDSVTIITYYPAPYGVYRNLKLDPTTQPNGPEVSAGVMYFDNRTNYKVIRYYNGTDWVNITEAPAAPAAPPAYWAASGANINNTNTGNVGIGMASPAYKLHVGGTINATVDVCLGSGKCLSKCLF